MASRFHNRPPAAFDFVAAVDKQWGIIPYHELVYSDHPAASDTAAIFWYGLFPHNNYSTIIMDATTWEACAQRPKPSYLQALVVLQPNQTPIMEAVCFTSLDEALRYPGDKKGIAVIGDAALMQQALQHPRLKSGFTLIMPDDRKCAEPFPKDLLPQKSKPYPHSSLLIAQYTTKPWW